MMLAAPPAAAMMYAKESKGLDPSVYAGGGSESSFFLDDSPVVSCGNAAFVAVTVSLDEVVGSWSSNASAAYAGAVEDASASVTADLYAWTASAVEA
jgi:hypothetical protein